VEGLFLERAALASAVKVVEREGRTSEFGRPLPTIDFTDSFTVFGKTLIWLPGSLREKAIAFHRTDCAFPPTNRVSDFSYFGGHI
jgi:hypothetical protein